MDSRIERAEKDIEKLQSMWKVLGRIEKQQERILLKLDEEHSCKYEKDIIQLIDFKENNRNSMSRTYSIILIIFTSLISFLLGYITKTF